MNPKKYDEKTRQVRKLSKVVIIDLLKREGSCIISKITFRVKKALPYSCDNEIMVLAENGQANQNGYTRFNGHLQI